VKEVERPMNLSDLEERFAIAGVLEFGASADGLSFAEVSGPAAAARVYLQGAHLASWTPQGFAPVLYVSGRSEFAPGRAIRGGMPVVFPWFGPRAGEPVPPHADLPGPSHGFARTTEWEPVFAAVSGEDVHLTLALGPSEESRKLGFDGFRAALRLRIGRTLGLELGIANDAGRTPLIFEEALHTYFAVADATRVSVTGLAGAEYLDKRDDMARKRLPGGPLVLTEATDRVFLDTEVACVIEDAAGARRIVVEKSGSRSTVVWNPWSTVTPTLPDMDPEGWRRMVCVEAANVGRNAVTLAAGESHTMGLRVSLETLA
jgi:glucose-6-phosphate 1-epimerase